MILLDESFGKASFILRMSLTLFFVACANDFPLLWYLDLVSTLALGLGGISGRDFGDVSQFTIVTIVNCNFVPVEL